MNVISTYAPQVGYELEEKEEFWNGIEDYIQIIPREERIGIWPDFIGHDNENVIGKYSIDREMQRDKWVLTVKRMEMVVVNTYESLIK